MERLYLEDFVVGQKYGTQRLRVDAEAIKAFAAAFDPQPFHLDEDAARASFFQGLTASGWHTAALTMRLLVQGDLRPAGGIIGVWAEEIKWPRAVRPGDELEVQAEVLGVRPSESRPGQGFVKVRSRTLNQHREAVQVLVINLLVQSRPPEKERHMAAETHGKDLGNREFFIQRWEQESPAFVRVFRALPPDRLDYRPHPKSRSAAELVAQLVSGQQSCIELCKNRKNFYNGLRWKEPGQFGGIEDMAAAYERDHDLLAIQLRTMEAEAWYQQAWLIQGDGNVLLKDTIGGLLWIALFDFVHHRGQLSTYIRPMGGTVPSIYGPSADAPAQSQGQ